MNSAKISPDSFLESIDFCNSYATAEHFITSARARRLEQAGRVKVVAHRKGWVNRVIMLWREGDPKATFAENAKRFLGGREIQNGE